MFLLKLLSVLFKLDDDAALGLLLAVPPFSSKESSPRIVLNIEKRCRQVKAESSL